MKRKSNALPHKIRIIAGRWRRRYITVSAKNIRPTPNRIRETLFNCLQNDIQDSHCLDLFAGTGALGFEALSRGAASVVFIDQHPQAITQLQETRDLLQAEGADIQRNLAPQCLETLHDTFDIVFLDPPFHQDILPSCIQALDKVLKPNALVYVEYAKHDALPPLPDTWQCRHEGQAGRVKYGLYRVSNDSGDSDDLADLGSVVE